MAAQQPPGAQTVSLVLSSGGARGLAHIGAIQCLDDWGFDIRHVSGSSMGALVGGIYAAGKLGDYADWVSALRRSDIVQLLDFGWGGGLFKGEKIIDALRELVGDRDIEDLPIGYTAVATDLQKKREVWINSGPLFGAIRASMAIPMVFSPVQRGTQLLVDGAVLNPLPIAPTLNNDTDLVVAVDVNGLDERALDIRPPSEPEQVENSENKDADGADKSIRDAVAGFLDEFFSGEENKKSHGMFDVAMESMDAMQVAISRLKLSVYSADLLIQIPRNICHFFEFERGRELIDEGYQRMQAALEASIPRDA